MSFLSFQNVVARVNMMRTDCHLQCELVVGALLQVEARAKDVRSAVDCMRNPMLDDAQVVREFCVELEFCFPDTATPTPPGHIVDHHPVLRL